MAADAARRDRFRGDVEGLRAVAILVVVLYHVGLPGLTGGYVGVDVFFVISGFLITSLVLRELARTGRISITAFYARRFVRLLPAAAVVVVVTLAAAWWWLPATRFRGIATDALFASFYGLNFDLAERGTDYLAAAEAPSPLQHFWSLAVEEQFYVVWPLMLSLASLTWMTRRRTVNRTFVAAVLAALVVGSIAVSVWQTRTAAPWAYFGTHARAWELGVGALVAVFASECARLPSVVATVAGWLGLAAIVVSSFLYTSDTAFPGYAALLPVGGAALIIAGGFVTPLRALRATPMQGIGTLSYSWYLWHWPFLLIGPYVLGPLNMVQKVMLALLALGASALTYFLVENRIRHRPVFKALPWRGVGLGLALSGLLAAAALIGHVAPLRSIATGAAAGGVDIGLSGSAAERQLAGLIAASATRERVPSNLSPTLADARADSPAIYANGCHRDIADTDVETGCVFGDVTADAAMVLFGDSHAAHWFDAIDAIAKRRGMRLVTVTKSACSAADARTVDRHLKREYTECGTWRDKARRHIRSLKPDLIVMSSNGSGGTISGVESGAQDAAWAHAWSRSVRALSRPGTKIVVISDTPWPSNNVPDCIAANSTDLGSCVRSPRQAIPQPQRRIMVADAVQAAGASVVDPTPWFCTPVACPVVVGNILVYRDDSHMTTNYSAALAGVLAEHLP